MKWLKAYTSFTRTERMGIIALLCIIAILIVVKATMYLWVQPDYNLDKEKELAEKWAILKQESTHNRINYSQSAIPTAVSSTLFTFDPNTIDATGLKKLGLAENTIRIFLNWRSKGKRFYKKEDFKELYTLSGEDYKRLAPYIRIIEHKINLNTADSVTLVSLPGIGAKLAHKILDYKKEIGKYQSVEQLLDVHHLSDSTMHILRQKLTTN